MSAHPKPVDEQVIPAEPGWAVVTLSLDQAGKAKPELYRISVIAWLIQIYHRSGTEETFVVVVPISVEGSFEDQDYALQHGDRPPFYLAFGEIDSQEALLAYFLKNERRS